MLATASILLSAALPKLLIVYVAAGFVVVAIQVQRRRARMQPLVEAAGVEPVLFRAPVQVKVRYYTWFWGTKTLGAMELSIGVATVRITTLPGIAGRVLGSEWFYSAPETQIRMTKLSTDPFRRDWITITGTIADRTEAIAVKPLRSSYEEVWAALLRAGCRPS
jgi:hypothetical protein